VRLSARRALHGFLVALAMGLPALGAPRPARAADTAFEGVVTYRETVGLGAPPFNFLVMLKGTRSRMEVDDLPEAPTIVITDAKTGIVLSLVSNHKLYMVSNIDAFAKNVAGMPSLSYTPTGRSETIAGRRCDHFVVGTADSGMDFCVATGMGYFVAGSGTQPWLSWDALRQAFPDGYVPLKAEIVGGGTRQWKMEATRIESRSLPDSLFVPPPGFTEHKTR
jgi:hypothetical protein